MNINREREALKKRLKEKEHRDAFVSAYVDKTIPFQVRAMRLSKERNWTQQELAKRTGMKQERISMCENPNYGRFSLQTLKQLASAFDVALIVRFAPFSELMEWELNMSPDSLEITNFEEDKYFKEIEDDETIGSFLNEKYSQKDQPQIKSDINKVFENKLPDTKKRDLIQSAILDKVSGKGLMRDINETAFG